MTGMKGQNVLPFCDEEMGKGTSGGDGLDEDDDGSHRGDSRFLESRVRIHEVRTQGGRDSGELDKSR